VIRGNMLSTPAGEGILNVQPVYVQSSGTDAAYPALRMVLVAFGEEVGHGDNLQEALDMIFDGDAGVDTAEGAGVDAEAVEQELGVDPDAEEEAAAPEEGEESPAPEDEDTQEAEATEEPEEETASPAPGPVLDDADSQELLERAGELLNEKSEA